MASSSPANAIPGTIGKYRVERELGRGASSTVYLAYDTFNRRHVAVKQIHAHLLNDERQAARYRKSLRNEATLAGQLRHPHIVRLFDADDDAHPPYLVLEYVQGESLASYTTADTLLPVAQVLDIAYKCCSALEHAHTRGLVHRDIKPANLMLQPSGDVKLTDFGTAMSLRADTTQLSGLIGSPCYMAPEQVREEQCTHLSDMFSLAVVVYELLTGRRPFEGDSDYATLYKIGNEEPAPLTVLRPNLPAELDTVVQRAMSKKPEHRYPSWPEFADALLSINRAMPTRRPNEREAERFVKMRALNFFADFHDAALWETLRLGMLQTHARGTALMKENTPGDSFCVLLEGRVTVSRNGWKFTTLDAGVTLGEMTYLQPGAAMRTATVVADTDVLVLEIRNAALRQASQDLQSRFDKAFINLLVGRLIATTEQVGNWDMGSVASRRVS